MHEDARRSKLEAGTHPDQEPPSAGAEEQGLIAARVLESMTEGVSVADESGTIIWTNPAEDRMFGYDPGELVGQHVSVQNAYPPEINQRIVAEVIEQLKTAGHWSGEWRNRRKDGSRFITQANITSIERGGRRLWVCVQRDVTRQKRGEMVSELLADAGKVLAASLDYETTLDNLAHLVVPRSADWCAIDLVQQADGAAPELRRVSVVHSDPAKVQLARELQSKYPPRLDAEHGVARVLRTGEPDWAAEISEEMLNAALRDQEYLRIIRGLELRSYIVVPLKARGRTLGALTLVLAESGRLYAQEDVAIIEELGRLAGTAVDNARLVASLRESEARKGAIFESALDCLITMDHHGHVVDFNSVAERTFGYRREDAVGKAVADLIIPPRLREAHWNGLRRFLKTGTAEVLGRRLEMPAIRADGSEITVELAISAVEVDGSPSFFTAFLRDISDRKQVEQQREQILEAERSAREEAERVGRMKDEFLATLSHELRTPLNAILGWSQLINREMVGEEELSAGLETIERNARAQAQLVEDLLDMSRIVSGKLNLDIRVVRPAEVIEAAIDSVRHAADAKQIRLTAVLEPAAGPIRGDPNRLQQVVWNLLSNAIKFTPKRGRVQVALERVNSHIAITVSDNGQGITPAFMPHVFDRFRQADAATTRRFGGLGLGLSIVKQIVELHGGSVRAQSPGEGQGATFVVDLPLLILHGDAGEEAREAALQGSAFAAQECASLKDIQVLVVDDEPDARDLVRRVLEACHANVVLAASADEAMQILKSQRPHIILSDIGMPGTDGYDLLRRVRALPPGEGGRTPAVALTALARSEDRRRALQAGYQVHVAKPLEPEELIAAIASLVNVTGTPPA